MTESPATTSDEPLVREQEFWDEHVSHARVRGTLLPGADGPNTALMLGSRWPAISSWATSSTAQSATARSTAWPVARRWEDLDALRTAFAELDLRVAGMTFARILDRNALRHSRPPAK